MHKLPHFAVGRTLDKVVAKSRDFQWLHGGLRIEEKIVVCCHMDIKLDNILVYLDRQASHVGVWKISDFGISSIVEREERRASARKKNPDLLSVPSPAGVLARITGSVKVSANRPGGAFSAPEVAVGNHIGPESDIWSFGCILFQILLRGVGGIKLLKDMDEKRAAFENGSVNDHFCQDGPRGQHLHLQVVRWLESSFFPTDLLHRDNECAKKCKKIIMEALKISPNERPKAHQLQKELLRIANPPTEQYCSDVESVSSFTSNRSRLTASSIQRKALVNMPPQIRIIPSSSSNLDRSSEASTKHPPAQKLESVAASHEVQEPPTGRNIESDPLPPQRPPTPPPERYDQFPAATLSASSPDSGPSSSRVPNLNAYSGSFSSPLTHRLAQAETNYRNPDSDSFKELSPTSRTAMVDRWAQITSPNTSLPPNDWRNTERQTIASSYHGFEQDRPSFGEPPQMYPQISERLEHPASPSTSASSELWTAQHRRSLADAHADSQPGLEAFGFPPNTGPHSLPDRSRQGSNRSSVQSSVHAVEAGPTNDRGETIPFQTPRDTFMTLVSSTRAKIAFVAPNCAVVSTLYSPYSRKTIDAPSNCKWEKGCMAGDYLALRGHCSATNTQVCAWPFPV